MSARASVPTPRIRARRLLRYIPTLLALAVAGACEFATGPRERMLTIEVAENVVPCHTWFETTCLQVRERESDPWRWFTDPIEGFRYVPGYRYMLRISEREIANPPADGSSVAYRLIAVLAKAAMPATTP